MYHLRLLDSENIADWLFTQESFFDFWSCCEYPVWKNAEEVSDTAKFFNYFTLSSSWFLNQHHAMLTCSIDFKCIAHVRFQKGRPRICSSGTLLSRTCFAYCDEGSILLTCTQITLWLKFSNGCFDAERVNLLLHGNTVKSFHETDCQMFKLNRRSRINQLVGEFYRVNYR